MGGPREGTFVRKPQEMYQNQTPPPPRRFGLPSSWRRQAVLRPMVAFILLGLVLTTLAAGAEAQSFDVRASAPTRAAATAALSARAARECGYPHLNRGWFPDHRVESLSCQAGAGRDYCQARVTCTPPQESALAMR